MKVSVISATYNRAALLDKALQTYSKQTLPFSEWEYLVCDDMSQDDTRAVVMKWKERGLNLRYYTAAELGHPKVPGAWRDGCKLRNAVSVLASGEVIVATHPEIMIPPNALQAMYETAIQGQMTWCTAMPYWLPNSEFTAGWEDDLFKLRNVVGFYDPSWPKPVVPAVPDYRNQNQETRNTWESEVFFAMRMSDWRWIGGFREFDAWGSVDMDFLSRRQVLGIKTVIVKGSPVPSGNLMVFHQWHDSKRDMDACVAALKGSSYSPQNAREMGGLRNHYKSISLTDKVKLITSSSSRSLADQRYVESLIRMWGLQADVLNPYGEDGVYAVEKGGLWQRPDQFSQYLVYLNRMNTPINSYLEIGVASGMTLVFTTAYLMATNPGFVGSTGVDINISHAKETVEKLNLPIKLIRGTSESFVGTTDLVLIDGEHTYKAALADFSFLDKKARLKAFHDIDADVIPEVREAWREISANRQNAVFVGPRGTMGIGLIKD